MRCLENARWTLLAFSRVSAKPAYRFHLVAYFTPFKSLISAACRVELRPVGAPGSVSGMGSSVTTSSILGFTCSIVGCSIEQGAKDPNEDCDDYRGVGAAVL